MYILMLLPVIYDIVILSFFYLVRQCLSFCYQSLTLICDHLLLQNATNYLHHTVFLNSLALLISVSTICQLSSSTVLQLAGGSCPEIIEYSSKRLSLINFINKPTGFFHSVITQRKGKSVLVLPSYTK